MADQNRQDSPQIPQAEPSGCLAAIARIVWMALGNIFLLILTLLIGQKGSFSVLDIFFWMLVGFLVFVRYYDIIHLQGLTGDGEPATMWHWRRYSVRLILFSIIIWSLGHAMGLLKAL